MKAKLVAGKYYIKFKGRGVVSAVLSKNQIKVINQLHEKKLLEIEGFALEGYEDTLLF
jgi:hypothetical protein